MMSLFKTLSTLVLPLLLIIGIISTPAHGATLTLPDTHCAAGNEVLISISISGSDSISAAQFDFQFDRPDFAWAQDVAPGELTSSFIVASNMSNGQVRIAMVGKQTTEVGTGPILSVPLQISDAATSLSTITLSLSDVILNDAYGNTLSVTTSSGTVTVYRAHIDTDVDGLTDDIEVLMGTSPTSDDTDEDGLKDGWEVNYGFGQIATNNGQQDPDGDDLTNLEEQNHGTNPLLADTDGDGCEDGPEVLGGRDPLQTPRRS